VGWRGGGWARLALAGLLAASLACGSTTVNAQSVTVRHQEGMVHGYLALRDPNGKRIGYGELLQTSDGEQMKSRVVFYFADGSTHDQTTVFSQSGRFRLLSDRLVQKGPSFPDAIDMSIDVSSGLVRVSHTDDDGETEVDEEEMEMPANLANGLIPILLKNVRPGELPLTLSFIAATPKPRLVELVVTSAGEVPYHVAGSPREAIHYLIETEIGGLAGLVAPLIGKQPPDSHVWVAKSEAPAFLKSQAPFYAEGPLWQIELDSPAWPGESRD
jgi:hypothetical protein